MELVVITFEGFYIYFYLLQNKLILLNFLQTLFLGECEILELLLSAGIDVDCFDSVYGTPLHAAAAVGEDGAVNILLEHHADVSNHFLGVLSLAVQKEILGPKRLCLHSVTVMHWNEKW